MPMPRIVSAGTPRSAQARANASRSTRPPLAKRRTSAKTGAMGRRDEALCEELKEVARRLGVEVREEILLREVGYRVRSGACRVRGEEVIFVDRNLPPEERVQVLLDG